MAGAGGAAARPALDDTDFKLLPFQAKMFESLASDPDCLVVLAKGLGLHRLVVNVLRAYCSPEFLVLVINTPTHICDSYVADLARTARLLAATAGATLTATPSTPGSTPCEPRVINADMSSDERHDIYLAGGVVFVTSRILVVDILLKRLPTHLVTGVFVSNAHRVVATSSEAFILRLYRHENRQGFIKAVTDHPEGFTGFNSVEKVMKALWVKKLVMWPRFHRSLMDQLAKHAPEVCEVKIPMTDRMLSVQQALAELIKGCLRELQRLRPSLDGEQMTLERGLFAAFDQYLRRQLDPIWHTLGAKTKQLVHDLRTLRGIVLYLHQYDCVSFYHYLETLRANHGALGHSSYWELMDAAQDLYVNAKWRVFMPPARKKTASPVKTRDLVPEPEANPKWVALEAALKEIEELMEHEAELLPPNPRTLVCMEDSRTCSQLQQVLSHGAEHVLEKQLHRYQRWRRRMTVATASGAFEKNQPDPKPSLARKGSSLSGKAGAAAGGAGTSRRRNKRRRIELAVMNAMSTEEALERLADMDEGSDNVLLEGDKDSGPSVVTAADPVQDFEAYGGKPLQGSVTILHALYTEGGGARGSQFGAALRSVQPSFVVLYDPTLTCLREVEVYKAAHPNLLLKVFFMTFDASFQEQKYLSSIRHEKDAFERLIAAKSRMAVPEDQDGRSGHRQELEKQLHQRPNTASSRKAGGQGGKKAQSKVIVDMREFRSTLPSLIHEFNMAIVPVTLTVGDYVLSPEICVERKSIPDLVQSLSSGRLYNQALAMSRYYSTPCLLIEFDEAKTFSLLGVTDTLSGDIDFRNITSKLTLLTISFPGLRLLWSRSAHHTAALFADLKTHSREPDAIFAASLGDADGAVDTDEYAAEPQAFLRKIPGVSSKNMRHLMEKTRNLRELIQSTEKKLQTLIGKADGTTVYNFFHNKAK